MGEYSADRYIGVIGMVHRNWTDGNQTFSDIVRGMSICIISTTNNDNIFLMTGETVYI